MLKEKIITYFYQYPSLRVLFFFDPVGEFTEEIATLTVDDVRIVTWDNNDFRLKIKLHGGWKNEKVFLYLPKAAPQTAEQYRAFPLLDLLVANKELRLDDETEFMEEYGLLPSQRALVKLYMRELKYKTTKEVCRELLNPHNFEEKALIRGLFSTFLKFKKVESWALIVAKTLTYSLPGHEEDLKKLTQKIKENGLQTTLSHAVQELLAQPLTGLDADALRGVLQRIRYNQITEEIPVAKENDPYRALKITKRDTLIYLNQLVQEVRLHEALHQKFQEALRGAEDQIKGTKLLQVYGSDAPFSLFTTDMLWAVAAQEQTKIEFNPKAVLEQLERLMLKANQATALPEYLGMMSQTAWMMTHINAIPTYILDIPEQYLERYTAAWYQIDQTYRKATRYYQQLDFSELPDHIEPDALHLLLNKRYEAFTEKLNREWLACMAQVSFDYRQLNAPKQYDFYRKEVAPFDQKTVVVISDALRYEVAHDLLGELHADTKNTAQIRYQLAAIPSRTSVGMAQLLPGTTWQFNEGAILLDGISTEGTENRQKLLSRAKSDAVAITFTDYERKNKDERRELFKASLVYLYHDVIDATGDKSPSERRTVEAVQTAIQELKTLIKLLHGTYAVARVLITADHGFLYNDREIAEKDKEKASGLPALKTHQRYEIVKSVQATPMAYQIPLSATSVFKDEWYVLTPKSTNRYKKQGASHQFVHGGGSLQELVVPIIESARKKQEVIGKVRPMLVSNQLRIVSNILRVSLLQEKKVGRFEKEITLAVGIYKDLELVSNEQTIVMNSTSDSPTDRQHRFELTLSRAAASETFLKLRVVDTDDRLNPLIEERIENSTLIQQDF